MGTQNGRVTVGTDGQFLYKHTLTAWLKNPNPRLLPNEHLYSHKKINTWMLITVLFIIAPNWKLLTRKTSVIHPIRGRNQLLIHPTTWVYLRCQWKKQDPKLHHVGFMSVTFWKRQNYRECKLNRDCQGLGERKWFPAKMQYGDLEVMEQTCILIAVVTWL